jgi:hypothetical protein
LIVNRRGRTGEIVLVDFDMEGKCYIVPQQFEPRVIKQLFYVAPGPSDSDCCSVVDFRSPDGGDACAGFACAASCPARTLPSPHRASFQRVPTASNRTHAPTELDARARVRLLHEPDLPLGDLRMNQSRRVAFETKHLGARRQRRPSFHRHPVRLEDPGCRCWASRQFFAGPSTPLNSAVSAYFGRTFLTRIFVRA